MNKLISRFLNMLLIIFITLLVLNKLYVIEFSSNLKSVLIFLIFIIVLITSTKEILIGKSSFLKLSSVVILLSIVVGGIFSVLNKQPIILTYICVLSSIFLCLFDFI